MAQDSGHKRLLQFVKRIVDVPLGYSLNDLVLMRSFASRDYIPLVPIIDEYIKLAENSVIETGNGRIENSADRKGASGLHLFDLLREKKLFPSNSDLAEFAAKILPGIKDNRFDKMSRGDIATRIIEYLETKDRSTRDALEISMREAMQPEKPAKPAERQSFLSKWEKIIKGNQL